VFTNLNLIFSKAKSRTEISRVSMLAEFLSVRLNEAIFASSSCRRLRVRFNSCCSLEFCSVRSWMQSLQTHHPPSPCAALPEHIRHSIQIKVFLDSWGLYRAMLISISKVLSQQLSMLACCVQQIRSLSQPMATFRTADHQCLLVSTKSVAWWQALGVRNLPKVL